MMIASYSIFKRTSAFPADIVLIPFSCYHSFTAEVKLWKEVVMQVNYKNRQEVRGHGKEQDLYRNTTRGYHKGAA